MSESVVSIAHVAALLRHAPMSASYKPALLKALVRSCRAEDVDVISLEVLGREFVRMYWNQTVVYHFRQNSVVSKNAEIIRVISESANQYAARYYDDLPPIAKEKLSRRAARILGINVLSAFHTSRPAPMPALFTWAKGDNAVLLTPGTHEFLRQNDGLLELIANYYWARFLERHNYLSPRIISKLSRENRPRQSLKPYLKALLAESGGACFYCGRAFGPHREAVVDHFLPWSFLLDDPEWDLVAACYACNNAKSDKLPDASYISRIVERNAKRTFKSLKVSLGPFPDMRIEQLYEAAVGLHWPGPWAPPI